MMTIARTFVTGDTHGTKHFRHLEKFATFYEDDLTKKDVMIICGDAGLTWFNDCCKNISIILSYNDLPCTIVIVDGNHENFATLRKYPEIEKFGGPVYKLASSVFYLQRGYVYEINGQTFFSFGGGFSYDSLSRIEHIDWWREEIPNITEMRRGQDNLKLHNNEVDYLITHTCALSDLDKLEDITGTIFDKGRENPEYFLNLYIEECKRTCKFKKHFFGHYHEDEVLDKHTTVVFESYWEITDYK